MNKTTEILLADDDLLVRSYLLKLLKIICLVEGYEAQITEVGDGEAAIAVMKQKREELSFVFSDLMMPKADGNEVARHAFSAGLPIILATATPDEVDIDVAPYCHAIIEKPIDLPDIKNAVMTLLFPITREAS